MLYRAAVQRHLSKHLSRSDDPGLQNAVAPEHAQVEQFHRVGRQGLDVVQEEHAALGSDHLRERSGCAAVDPDERSGTARKSPHDTHDWDNVETPVLFDATIDGRPRRLLAQASRAGYFFVLDRTNGTALVSKGFVGVNWSKGVDAKGQPIPDPAKEPKVGGSLVNTPAAGGTNWFAPSYDPETGLFYVQARRGFHVAYLYDTSPKPQGYAGGGFSLWGQSVLEALDVRTGAIKWAHEYGQTTAQVNSGILTTAGGLLFTGSTGTNLVAHDPATGKILWHQRLLRAVSNGPSTWMLDGAQHLIVGAGDMLYAFTLPASSRTPSTR